MTTKVADLLKQRGAAFDAYKALAEKPVLTAEEQTEYETRRTEVRTLDAQVDRAREAQELAVRDAQPVAGQEVTGRVFPKPESDPYVSRDAAIALGLGTNKGLVVGGMLRMIGRAQESHQDPVAIATRQYGESHPVVGAVRALVVGTGDSGGFIVPPDYQAEIIELLRPMAVVRGAGPRNMPMPRGTMRLPGQASAASAGYGPEGAKIAASQQKLRSIVATFKKLTALVPVSNDMMRYASPAVDAFVRDDLVKVMALTEDKNFILGDGTADTPMGWLTFANLWVGQNTGTVGVWSIAANSTFAVNGADPANSTGGNFISSTQAYTLSTVASELGGAINRLDQANVPDTKRVWFMNPRSYNYLFNVQNSLGVYVYRDELSKGTLLGYPVKKTTQIGTNYFNTDGSHTDCSFVFLAEMDEAIILDSMQLELAVSREGSYIDSGGTTVSAFQSDQTIIRAIAEHDFQVRHDQSVAVIQGVRWAPAIS
jgi:HK97 family phage major capsid protein